MNVHVCIPSVEKHLVTSSSMITYMYMYMYTNLYFYIAKIVKSCFKFHAIENLLFLFIFNFYIKRDFQFWMQKLYHIQDVKC